MFNWFRKDPTRDWPEPRRVPLIYDIAQRALNGVKLGAPAEQLRYFGRPASRKYGSYGYPQLGLEIQVLDERVMSFFFLVGSVESISDIGESDLFEFSEPVFRAPSGEDVIFGPQTDRLVVERALGPLSPTGDGDPTSLCTTRAGVYYGFEFTSAGMLSIVDVELER